VKPIIGEEVYWAIGSRRDHDSIRVPREFDDGADAGDADTRTGAKTKTYEHLTLLAQTSAGWSNLSRMATASADSFWSKPRMDFELLEEHRDGLIVLSGCIGGPVAGRLLRGDTDGAREQLTMLRDIVGPDNCFVELMDHGIPAENRIRTDLLELARYAGVRPVATNDCHYATEQEQAAHDLWLCVGQQDTMVSDPDRWRFTGSGYHMRPAHEMYDLFSGAEQACDNTLLIADMVADRVLPETRQRLPRFDVPAGFADAPAYLRHLVAAGAARRYGDPLPAAVRARLNLEFRTIRQLAFADYFLIVHDVVTAARANGILVGPGRGSAAGSLVLFCLGVVAVDPLANGLLFERFLDPDRTDMPDVDLDFDSDGQAWVFSYLTRRWGADRVARLGTFGYARGRQAVKDAARVLLPTERRAAVGNALAARVPTATAPLALLLHPDNPDGAALRAKAVETPDHGRVLDAARQIDGKVRSEGVHACGVVIATEPLDAVVPLRRDRREGRDDTWVTQWDGADITALGMLKLDVLAIKNLDMVKRAVALIADRTGEQVDPENLPTEPGDPRVKATWELIRNGRTAGLFQLASPGMTELARQIGPENLNDLSALVALFRPGPLGEKMHERFARRRSGREPVDYGIFTDEPAEQAVLADVLGETLGSIVYQEQMMRLGTVMAGFTPAQSSRLRKAVSKKNPAEMAAVGAMFAAGCAVQTRDDDGAVTSPVFAAATATRVWDAMKHAAAFAFNKSHSYAYGSLAYTTAFLKANWPVEYGAAVLGVATRDDKRQQAFDDLADDGITVLPASVNDSDTVSAAVAGGAIRLGLAEVKGVAAAADAIVAERRRGGPFRSLPDLLRRVGVGDGTGPEQPLPTEAVDALIEAGACDEFGARLGLLQVARAARDHPGVLVPVADWGALERARRERDRTGTTLTGHPLRLLGPQLRQWRAPGATDGAGHDLGMRPTPLHRLPAAGHALTIGLVTEYAERPYSRGRMATLTLEGSRGRLRGVIWDQVLTELHHRGTVPVAGRVVAVRGRITSGTRPVDVVGSDAGDNDGFETVEQVPAREMMVSNVFPLDIDDRRPTWTPPAAPSITDLWTTRRGNAHRADELPPQPPALLRTPEPVTGPPNSRTELTARQVPAAPAPPTIDSRRPLAVAAEPQVESTVVTLDVLTVPAGASLRRACIERPGVLPLLARYPELAVKQVAECVRSAAPHSRSGLLPHRADTGCYLVVLIGRPDSEARVDTATSETSSTRSDGTAEATARRMLAAHLDGMATKKTSQPPVVPVKGQLPLFPLPGQLPEPAPATGRPAPPVQTHRGGTAA
jgi:DNA polymerase-3 subunit alpha